MEITELNRIQRTCFFSKLSKICDFLRSAWSVLKAKELHTCYEDKVFSEGISGPRPHRYQFLWIILFGQAWQKNNNPEVSSECLRVAALKTPPCCDWRHFLVWKFIWRLPVSVSTHLESNLQMPILWIRRSHCTLDRRKYSLSILGKIKGPFVHFVIYYPSVALPAPTLLSAICIPHC